jgi:hypothetical protein
MIVLQLRYFLNVPFRITGEKDRFRQGIAKMAGSMLGGLHGNGVVWHWKTERYSASVLKGEHWMNEPVR